MAAVVVSSPELEPSSVQPMGKALLFQPRKDQDSLQQPLGNIPRYLFRLYAPRSAGVTNSNAVVSPEAASKPGSEPGTDLLQLPRQRAANMLWGHLNWKRLVGDNLMSWTSSLLFALQHGLRRAKKDYDEPTLSDIQLCVVDTRDFPRGTFIKDLDVMKAYSDFPNIRSFLEFRQGNDYYYGEYLSQGRLEIAGRAQHTSLSTMIDLGLYDIEPELQYEHEILCKRINALRNAFAAPNNAACPLSKKEARKAITVAQGCFGDRFALPFAAMLLSLRRRREMDPVILDAFAAMFTGMMRPRSTDLANCDVLTRRKTRKSVPSRCATSRWSMARGCRRSSSSNVLFRTSAERSRLCLGGPPRKPRLASLAIRTCQVPWIPLAPLGSRRW